MSDSREKKPDSPIKVAVPPFGNLGLLAYGYKGLLAWRKAREEAAQSPSAGSPEQPDKS